MAAAWTRAAAASFGFSPEIWYNEMMESYDKRLTSPELADAKTRRLEAMHLQEIESNPLDPTQVAMFEMFEREAWSHERRREYIRQLYSADVSHAAE